VSTFLPNHTAVILAVPVGTQDPPFGNIVCVTHALYYFILSNCKVKPMFEFKDKVALASVNPFDSSRQSRSESTYLLLSRLQISNRRFFLYVKKEKATMFVRSALCLLVVLTCYLDNSVLAGKLRWTRFHCMVRYSETTGWEKPFFHIKYGPVRYVTEVGLTLVRSCILFSSYNTDLYPARYNIYYYLADCAMFPHIPAPI